MAKKKRPLMNVDKATLRALLKSNMNPRTAIGRRNKKLLEMELANRK